MAEQPNPPATILPSTVIVLHPGAYNLRLGFASESSPFIIPHVIARRIYDAKASTFKITFINIILILSS